MADRRCGSESPSPGIVLCRHCPACTGADPTPTPTMKLLASKLQTSPIAIHILHSLAAFEPYFPGRLRWTLPQTYPTTHKYVLQLHQMTLLNRHTTGTSPVVQWWRLCASTAGGTGSIPSQGTKMMQPKEPTPRSTMYLQVTFTPAAPSPRVPFLHPCLTCCRSAWPHTWLKSCDLHSAFASSPDDMEHRLPCTSGVLSLLPRLQPLPPHPLPAGSCLLGGQCAPQEDQPGLSNEAA